MSPSFLSLRIGLPRYTRVKVSARASLFVVCECKSARASVCLRTHVPPFFFVAAFEMEGI